MKSVTTMIVIADDKVARFLLNEGVGKGLREVADMAASQFPEDTREFSDRPGRSTAGAGGAARHGVDAQTGLEQQHRSRFAAHVLQALDQAWTQCAPDRMILAAPPKMLGELRARLQGRPKAALMADVPKDLVNVPLPKMAAHFADLLAL